MGMRKWHASSWGSSQSGGSFKFHTHTSQKFKNPVLILFIVVLKKMKTNPIIIIIYKTAILLQFFEGFEINRTRGSLILKFFPKNLEPEALGFYNFF
jgi:hypothetical protein